MEFTKNTKQGSELTQTGAVCMIWGIATILNYKKSNGFTGTSFYKNENGKKLRIADHAQTEKWASLYGYADHDIRLYAGQLVAEAIEKIAELNLDPKKVTRAGWEALEEAEKKDRYNVYLESLHR